VKKGYGSRPLYLKGRRHFIDRPKVPSLWYGYFTICVKLYNVWAHRLEMSVCRAWRRLSNCLLVSRASTWLVLETVLGVVTALLHLAWLLSHPTWGLMRMG
jgi:hypothetical protein